MKFIHVIFIQDTDSLYCCFLSGFHSPFSKKDFKEMNRLLVTGKGWFTTSQEITSLMKWYQPERVSQPNILTWGNNPLHREEHLLHFLVGGTASFLNKYNYVKSLVKIWQFDPKSGWVSSHHTDRKRSNCSLKICDFAFGKKIAAVFMPNIMGHTRVDLPRVNKTPEQTDSLGPCSL